MHQVAGGQGLTIGSSQLADRYDGETEIFKGVNEENTRQYRSWIIEMQRSVNNYNICTIRKDSLSLFGWPSVCDDQLAI